MHTVEHLLMRPTASMRSTYNLLKPFFPSNGARIVQKNDPITGAEDHQPGYDLIAPRKDSVRFVRLAGMC